MLSDTIHIIAKAVKGVIETKAITDLPAVAERVTNLVDGAKDTSTSNGKNYQWVAITKLVYCY
jgi:hypothetical protein